MTSNNTKKEPWHCFSSRYAIEKWVAQSVKDWLATYKVPKETQHALTFDLVEAINRECRVSNISKNPSNISALRQWLNEDRITDPSKMVRNEEIEFMLGLITVGEYQERKKASIEYDKEILKLSDEKQVNLSMK